MVLSSYGLRLVVRTCGCEIKWFEFKSGWMPYCQTIHYTEPFIIALFDMTEIMLKKNNKKIPIKSSLEIICPSVSV